MLNHVVVNQTSTYITALFFIAQPGLSARGVVGHLILLMNIYQTRIWQSFCNVPGTQIFVGPSSMAKRFKFMPKFNGKRLVEYELRMN